MSEELGDALNTMIQSMASVGRLDSAGEFTISLEHAAEKLADYRLVDPALFVLNLVACAVVSQAETFTVTTSREQTRFYFNRFPHGPDDLQQLFNYILEPKSPSTLRELALAVHGAQALSQEPEIGLLLSRPDGSWSIAIEGKGVQIEPIEGLERLQGLELILTYPKAAAWASFLGLKSNSSGNILEQLFHFCRFAPLALSLDGRPKGSAVSVGVHDEGFIGWCHLVGRQPLRTVPPGRRHDIFRSRRQQSSIDSSMALALASPELASREGLLIISRGVAFRRPNTLLGTPIACAVVTADHLEKNLSQSDLAEDAAYRELIEHLCKEVETMMLEVCADPPLWRDTQQLHFERALSELFKGRKLPAEIESFRRLNELKRACRDPEALAEHVAFLSQLEGEQDGSTRRLRKELFELLESRASEAIVLQQWKQAEELMGQLAALGAPKRWEVRALLLVLAQEPIPARQAWEKREGAERFPPVLELLCGFQEEVESSSIPTQFARFEKAIWAGDQVLANQLAGELEQATPTPFLTLWLGYFALGEGQLERTATLWASCLSCLPQDERVSWGPLMWKRLRGRVSLSTQIRWEVRLGFEALRLSTRGYQNRAEPFPDWIRRVWEVRARGEFSQSKQVFLDHYLPHQIESRSLKLNSPTSNINPVGVPSS